MPNRLLEALESRLVALEVLRLEWIGETGAPAICADCYATQDECVCDAPILWPLSAAVYKLRAELATPRSDSNGAN